MARLGGGVGGDGEGEEEEEEKIKEDGNSGKASAAIMRTIILILRKRLDRGRR